MLNELQLLDCPKCGSNNIFSWLIGVILGPIIDGVEHPHDPNRQRCGDCGHCWFKDCPICGTWQTWEQYQVRHF
jgi:hypothetical protein